MNKPQLIKFITTGGILTTMSVIFQAAPIYLSVIGLALSPFSTLPIAIAGVTSISLCLYVFFASLFILFMISLEEALIFLFTTGLLGLIVGILIYRKGTIVSIIISSLVLSIGMILLTYIIEISGFKELTNSLTLSLTLSIFFSFSLFYSSVWIFCFVKFITHLNKIIVIVK